MVIVGNAGAGKTTLARRLVEALGLARLSLDDVVWDPVRRRLMRDPRRVREDVIAFARAHEDWVIEGVYAAHLGAILDRATHLVWLDVDPALCARRVRARGLPAEGWGGEDKRAARLAYVEAWAASYAERDDRDSRAGHRALYAGFDGERLRVETGEVDVVTWVQPLGV